MYKISVELEGLAPFLFNRMSDTSGLTGAGKSGGVVSEAERIKEAKEKVYKDKQGILVWPAWNLKRMLVDGCAIAKLKEGKTALGRLVMGTVFPTDGSFGVKAFGLHECVGKIPPRTGRAAIIRRPILDTGWKLKFSLNVIDERRDEKMLKRGLEEAGLLVGLGSWRPEYGRFLIREWKVS